MSNDADNVNLLDSLMAPPPNLWLSIFIDGGYYNTLQRNLGIYFDFSKFLDKIKQTIESLIQRDLSVVHTFYYDCLPLDEKDKKASFFRYLQSVPTVQVREGRLVKRDESALQKGVDLLLGLDIAEECHKRLITHLALVTGDGDFVPAVETASRAGVQTWLIHAEEEDGYARPLWSAADGRIPINREFTSNIGKSTLQA